MATKKNHGEEGNDQETGNAETGYCKEGSRQGSDEETRHQEGRCQNDRQENERPRRGGQGPRRSEGAAQRQDDDRTHGHERVLDQPRRSDTARHDLRRHPPRDPKQEEGGPFRQNRSRVVHRQQIARFRPSYQQTPHVRHVGAFSCWGKLSKVLPPRSHRPTLSPL